MALCLCSFSFLEDITHEVQFLSVECGVCKHENALLMNILLSYYSSKSLILTIFHMDGTYEKSVTGFVG